MANPNPSPATRFTSRPANAGRKKGVHPNRLTWQKLHDQCKREFGAKLAVDHPKIGRITDLDVLLYVRLWEAVAAGKSWAISQALDRRLGKPPISSDPNVPSSTSVHVTWATPTAGLAKRPDEAGKTRSGLSPASGVLQEDSEGPSEEPGGVG